MAAAREERDPALTGAIAGDHQYAEPLGERGRVRWRAFRRQHQLESVVAVGVAGWRRAHRRARGRPRSRTSRRNAGRRRATRSPRTVRGGSAAHPEARAGNSVANNALPWINGIAQYNASAGVNPSEAAAATRPAERRTAFGAEVDPEVKIRAATTRGQAVAGESPHRPPSATARIPPRPSGSGRGPQLTVHVVGRFELAVGVRDVALELGAAARRVDADDARTGEGGAEEGEHEVGGVVEQDADVRRPDVGSRVSVSQDARPADSLATTSRQVHAGRRRRGRRRRHRRGQPAARRRRQPRESPSAM